ncbi:unnamed protein product [Paramecium sonneborni]|uniref:USP domain-containing protein n=1 Tax=Paramecium sonneborni TaxID=65129 RepID=A0A8S1MLR1_9CILI|nr:unnamed protein product [Paramecium sonneborni]
MQIIQTSNQEQFDPNPHSFQSMNDNDITYNLDRIIELEQTGVFLNINDKDYQSDINELQNSIFPRWMPILLELEIEIKAILLNKVNVQPDLISYFNKRVFPIMDYFLNKLFTDQKQLKVSCYFNEILLMLQKLGMNIWKQYQSISLALFKRIFVFPEVKFFDSHFNEGQFKQALGNFYFERDSVNLQSEYKDIQRKDENNFYCYYPLKGEILEDFHISKSSIHLSPFLRIQMHYFYQNGGFALLIDGINNFYIAYLDILDIFNYFSIFVDKQKFINYFQGLKEQLKVLHLKINEDDIKLSTKEQVKKLNETLEKALLPFYTFSEMKEIIVQQELSIYLQYFKCSTFEKRIFGLQQISEKINSLNYMNFYVNYDIVQKNDDNILKDILINFLVKNKIFQELFGEKAHFELIKRSSQIIRFLYRNNQLQTSDIIQILKMGKGKHESWSNFLFKLLNDIAEIMSESDMEVVLQEIQEQKVDSNILNFINCLGRNQNFDKKYFQQKKETKDTILTELEIEQESIQNSNKNSEKLTIKVYNEEQQQSENQYLINRNQDRKLQQQQQQFEIKKRNIQNDDSIDTNYEEGEGIRGRIVEYLLNVSNSNSNIDLGQQAFKIAMDLICLQFRFLRIKYLNQAFQKLFENDSKTENHIQMISKIIQSQYPIDNYNSQSELIKYLEQKYNFKMSLLAVIAKVKKRVHEQNKDRYTEVIEQLLKFYQSLYLLTDNKIESHHLQIIWQVLVKNAFTVQEQDLFFRWIFSSNKNIISLDALQMLFFDHIIKIDCNSYTVPIFQCLQNLILYFNIQHKILKNDVMDSYIIQDADIVGLEILWKVFFCSNNKEIVQKAQQFLLQITCFKSINQSIMNKLKQNYIEHIFDNVQNNTTEKCLDLCIKLLEEVEGMKYLKQDSFEKGEQIDQNILIIIDNRCKNAQHPKRQEISVPENMKIIYVKQIIGQKINPQVKRNEIDVVYRGNWLDNSKSLKDYKFDKKPTFQVLMRPQQDENQKVEDSKPLAICQGDVDELKEVFNHPKLNKVIPLCVNEPIPLGIPVNNQLNSNQQETIQSVIEITNEFNKEFVEYFLNENNWNFEMTVMELIDNREFHFQKFQEKQIRQVSPLQEKQNRQLQTQLIENQISNPQQPQGQFQKVIQNENNIQLIQKFSVATFISENNNYIQKLFDVLNLNNENLNSKVWQILSMIPRNREIYELIDKCQQTSEWENLLDQQNKYKLYYNLQILKELLDCDFIDDQDELRKRKQCRENFLIQGGLIHIQQLFFMPNVDPNTIQLALEIFLIYFTAYVLSKVEKNDEFCSRIINLKETVRNQYKQFEDRLPSISFYNENSDSDKSKLKYETASNSQSSGVSTPKFNNVSTIPPLTPPIEEHLISISKQLQQVQDNFDERHMLILQFKENQLFQEFLDFPYDDLLNSLINKIDLGFEQIFQTILLILYQNPTLVQTIYETENFPLSVIQVLSQSQIQECRRILTYSLIQICKIPSKNVQKDFGFYLLKELIPQIVNPQTQFEDIFILTAVILQRTNYDILTQNFDFQDLSQQIIQKIIDRPIIEERFEDNEDKVIQGYLILLTAIIEICPQTKESLSNELIRQVYEFLFHLNDDYAKYPKFKRKLTRKRAFHLLIEASKNCEKNFLLLLDPISNTHGRIEQPDQDFDTGVKGHYGFVGLKNLGATCYINSLLQQLFMNKAFRHGILNSQISITENNETIIYDDVDQIKSESYKNKLLDHTLYQLQLVFIQLQDSVRSFINPIQFIRTLQGYDGLPINCSVQQDVNEFFNLLTDKLEKDQKGTQQQDLINQIMGGTLGHEIRSLEQDIQFQRETDEVFLTVTIEIKNKKNLEEALDLFIKADVLDGENKYFCESINRRIDAEKRCYFKKLPNTFIFTLKRFEFDYNRMLKLKVNDYFEFPSEINMFKWTKDHLINNLQLDDYTDYIYKLVGVLIHTGSADSGHYYSFIKSQENKWFEFDDRFVSPFKFENLKYECFGGNNEYYNSFDWDSNKSKNAYLLFYEKIDKQDIQIMGTNEKCLQNNIIQENIVYLKNQLFYSSDYQAFVREFVCQFNFEDHQEKIESQNISQQDVISNQESPSLKVVKLFTLFSLESLIKNKDQSEFVNSVNVLCALYDKVVSASFWFLTHLQNNLNLLINTIIESTQQDVKHAFSKLLIQAIQCVVNYEEEQQHHSFNQENSTIMQFLSFFIDNLLPTCKKSMRRASEFFQILKFSISTSSFIIDHLQKKGYLQMIYKLYKETILENQVYGNCMNISKLNDKGLEGTCSAMCELICKTIQGSFTDGMKLTNEKTPTYLFQNYNQHVKLDNHLLTDIRDLGDYKIIFAPMVQLNPIVVDMTKHLCFDDIQTSEIIIEQLIQILLDWNMAWHQIDPIFHIIESILKISDAFGEMRFQVLMETQTKLVTFSKGKSILDAISKQFQNDKNFAYCLASWIAEIIHNFKVAQNYFSSNKSLIENILGKLNKYKDYQFYLNFPVPKIIRAIDQLNALFNKSENQNIVENAVNNNPLINNPMNNNNPLMSNPLLDNPLINNPYPYSDDENFYTDFNCESCDTQCDQGMILDVGFNDSQKCDDEMF